MCATPSARWEAETAGNSTITLHPPPCLLGEKEFITTKSAKKTDLERDLPLGERLRHLHLPFLRAVKSARSQQVYPSISNIFQMQATCVFHKY